MNKLNSHPFSDYIIDLVNNWLGHIGLNHAYVDIVRTIVLLIIVTGIIIILWWVTRKVLIKFINVAINRSKTNWDDYLLKHRFFAIVSNLMPLFFMDGFIYTIFSAYPRINNFLTKTVDVVIILVILIAILRFLSAANEILSKKKQLKDKPIQSYIQLAKILIGGFMIILGLSVATGQSPVYFLTSLGAATAILLLVFRDTILGFVGSIQLAANDMVRIGDWITMEKYGADGDVVEINLATVKVQNFDKTITTIPTYSFISDSFKNWRGMEMSDGRRIKRALKIEVNSIVFCDDAMLKRIQEIDLLRDYIEDKQNEILKDNASKSTGNHAINGRSLTNIGLYRKYIEFYLKENQEINQDMTLMVRQLKSTELGVPIEIYCFSKHKDWGIYEGILADIFDHVFAATKYFELVIFERPSGKDVSKAILNS